MSKGLEAIKHIEDNLVAIHSRIPHPECPDLIRFVRKTYDIDLIEKELKALEIIKREPSMVGWQAGYEDYEDYLDNTPEEQRFIKNKEEFDLLKEVLS